MTFEEIYQIYWQKVFRICMGYVNNTDLAKDMAQETFITVWQQLPKFRNESSLGTWIFRIASNNCLRQLEKQNRMPMTGFPMHLAEGADMSIEKKVQFLYKCIAELPEMERVIISLELEGVNQAEISNIVGLSEVNIRVKIHRIKEKLTQKFTHYDN